MAMKSLKKILATQPSSGPAVSPVKSGVPRMTENDTLVVSKLMDQLKLIFPAWKQAFPTSEMQQGALAVWTKALVEVNCTSHEQLSRGMQVARSQDCPFFPSPGQFIQWCQLTPESLGLPSVEQAWREVCNQRYTQLVVKHAAMATNWERKTLSQDEYRPVFEHAYCQMVRRVMEGEDIEAEVRKGLPAREQVQHSPEYFQKAGQRGVVSLRKLFKPKQGGGKE